MSIQPSLVRFAAVGERRLSLPVIFCLLLLGFALPGAGQIAPIITIQPQDQESCLGGSVTFRAAATGTAPFNFIWHSNGIPVFSQMSPSNSTFTILNLQPGNHGDEFFVQVDNAYGSTNSSVAHLAVPNPGICEQPLDTVVAPGETIQFQVVASGDPPLAFQWRFEGTPLTNGGNVFGAQSPTLVISNAQSGDAGMYRVVVSNGNGTILSREARCHIGVAPTINLQPVSRVARFRANTAFNLSANGTPPLSFQWYRNDQPLLNGTNAILTLTDVQRPHVGLYHVAVSNFAGLTFSERAHLQIRLTLEGSPFIPREEATDELPSLTNAITLFFAPPPTVVHHGVPLLFTTYASTIADWETNFCGAVASNSMWVVYYSPRAELTRVSTEGSDFDTVLSVYTWDGNPKHQPVLVACDNDSGYDGVSSRLYFSPAARQDYYISVAGVNGATGTTRLEVGETIRNSVFTNGTFRFEMAGSYWFDNTLQSDTNAAASPAAWPVLLTMPATNRDWVIGYTNTAALTDESRFYVVGVNTNSAP